MPRSSVLARATRSSGGPFLRLPSPLTHLAVAARLAFVGAAGAGATSCAGSAAPAEPALVFYLRGLRAGEERWTGVGDTTQVQVVIHRGPGVDLRGRIVRRVDAGPEIVLTGRQFPWVAPATDGPSPRATLPVAALAELARHRGQDSVDAGALPRVSSCGTHQIGGAELRCRDFDGLGWGATLLWIDPNGAAGAAFIPTPLGPLVGVRPSATASAAADSVLSLAARVTAERIAERLPEQRSESFAIVGARIVTMADRSQRPDVIEHGTILVRADRIAAVGPAPEVEVGGATPRINGRGMTVLPGLWDSHAHLRQAEWLPAYLAAGVTTVRDLGGDVAFLRSLRSGSDPRTLPIGPRILAAGFINDRPGGTPPYTSAAASSPDEARMLVRGYRDAGYELIKLWNALDDDVARAAVEEARAADMPVTWHVPDDLDVGAALDLGVDEINHVWSVLSFGDPDFRRSRAGRTLLQRMIRRGVALDPTLVVAAYQARLQTEPLVRFEPCAAWMPAETVRAWAAFGSTQDEAAATRAQLTRARRAVKALHDAGVPIVAGSDQGIPGCTLIRELELYVEAGLTPVEALRSATVTPARVAGMLDRVGTVEANKAADLVMVAGDPLVNISALRDVHLVVRGGRVLDPDALRRAARFLRP